MVYVLLDTNIIIDIVVDRRDNVISGNLLKTFIKLLDYGEIKLVLPNVVKEETYRHLDSELEEVGKKIDSTMKALKALYGISTYDMEPLDLTEYKKNARAELNKAQNQFNQHKVEYQKDIRKTIELLFNHDNTNMIDDEGLMSKVLKRRTYKRAPFHKESKESYGDGTITETLINLKSFIDIRPSDKILFVTGNYEDFSENKCNKENLHPHIAEDIKAAGLDSQVVYIRSFDRLISVYLRDNVKNADLAEEFEAEMNAEKKAEEDQYYQEIDDLERESVGLTALGSFVNQVEEEIPESQFAADVVEQFDRLNQSYGALEELSAFYEDELNVDGLDCSELVSKLAGIVGSGTEPTVENVKAILGWIDNRKSKCEMIDEPLPDSVLPGEDVEFWDVQRKKYLFSIDSLEYLVPDNGGFDTIDVQIKDVKGRDVATGTIEINYGFIEEDPFDGVGDGCEEGVGYNTDEIVEKLKEIADEWEGFISENEKTVDEIKAALDL